MRKVATSFLSSLLFPVSGLFFLNLSVTDQETKEVFPGLPDTVNKIVSVSCVPCHTSSGKILPKAKLNFSEWTQYAPEKKSDKADEINSVLKEGTMPPKSVRETRPDIVLTEDQKNIINKWTESFNTGINK